MSLLSLKLVQPVSSSAPVPAGIERVLQAWQDEVSEYARAERTTWGLTSIGSGQVDFAFRLRRATAHSELLGADRVALRAPDLIARVETLLTQRLEADGFRAIRIDRHDEFLQVRFHWGPTHWLLDRLWRR